MTFLKIFSLLVFISSCSGGGSGSSGGGPEVKVIVDTPTLATLLIEGTNGQVSGFDTQEIDLGQYPLNQPQEIAIQVTSTADVSNFEVSNLLIVDVLSLSLEKTTCKETLKGNSPCLVVLKLNAQKGSKTINQIIFINGIGIRIKIQFGVISPPNEDEISGGTDSLRWSKDKFPLKIIIPCIKDTTDPLYVFMNCNDILNSERADFVKYPLDQNADYIIDSILAAIQSWNSALRIQAFELEFSGVNKVLNDSPVTYLSNSEALVKRIAFLSNWFSSMNVSDPNKPGENVLAVTIYSYSQTTKRLIDADILINLKKFSFITQPVESSYRNYCSSAYPASQASCDLDQKCAWVSGSCKENPKFKGNMHFQSILTHELGHFLGMEHVALVTDSSSIMNPSLSSETIKVNLSSSDKCRINQRYRDVFILCDEGTATNKFCYDLTNVHSIGVISGQCVITSCKSGFNLNSNKTACSIGSN